MAAQIVDMLLEVAGEGRPRFYDLCCGSAAISIELVNRGVDPQRIWMLDASSWGTFWSAISHGTFDMAVFDRYLRDLPTDKRELKAHMTALAARPVGEHEAELYPLLQACSFGGKQIWLQNRHWSNACFRDYWQPTATSVRRSPANPMQPSPVELRRRVASLAVGMKGVNCMKADVTTILDTPLPDDAVVYIDPPYQGTTGYGFDFDVQAFVARFRTSSRAALLVSEERPLNASATKLALVGAKGGITGVRKGRHQEWLTRF